VGESGLMERIGRLEETQKEMGETQKETLNLLKRQFDDSQTFSLSTMNTQKRLKLCARFGVKPQVEVIAFNNFERVDDTPSPFVWLENVSENDHSEGYIDYIQNTFLGAEFLTGYQVLDVHSNPKFWKNGIAHGTTDAVVIPSVPKALSQNVVKLVFELKKISSKKPIVMLTDFSSTFNFYWIGRSRDQSTTPAVYMTSFNDASTFARALLAPDRVVEHIAQENRDNLPLDEKRVVIMELVYDETADDDIANLDDFVDEMEPEERASYEITKKLKRFRPFVPPTFRE
ncbi:5004_t:CDS:2, partial [Ambispora leptoticha]